MDDDQIKFDEESAEEANKDFHEDKSSECLVFTKRYGKLNMLTAEKLLLNGGKSSLSTTSRRSRFTGDPFGISSDIRLFTQAPCNCNGKTQIGDSVTLPTVKGKGTSSGTFRFISIKGAPLKFHCSEHSLASGSPNFWLLVDDATSVRCFIPT